MSWFNDTFGDSLNSLKGQFTKITKEVLAEDDSEKEEEIETVKSQLRELDALCRSKDLEIAGLREENQKISQRFQEELKFLRNENKKLKTNLSSKNENVFLDESQIPQICELENELHQLRLERDHLEELQRDHQSNICLVMQQRDNCKCEMEKIKQSYSDLKVKYDELLNLKNDSSPTNNMSDINLLDIQNKDDELVNLKNLIEKLQSEKKLLQQDKEEMSKAIAEQMSVKLDFERERGKVLEELKNLEHVKDNAELENQKLKEIVDAIKTDLKIKIDDFEAVQKEKCQLEENMKTLVEKLEMNKVEQSAFKDVEVQVKNLLKTFPSSNSEKYSDEISLSEAINIIKNIWNENLTERENKEEMYKVNLHKFESEINRLKNEKTSLEDELQKEIDRKHDLECNYKKEINSLQNKYLELKSQEQDCIIKSQTDDVKRLDQEVSKLMEVIEIKNNELGECYDKLNAITQELNAMKSLSVNSEHELYNLASEKEHLENSLLQMKSSFESKEKEMQEMIETKEKMTEKCKTLEDENLKLSEVTSLMQDKLNEIIKKNEDLENNISSLKNTADRSVTLERELEDTVRSKTELEKICSDMQQLKLNYDSQSEYLKSQIIIKESNIAELTVKNQDLNKEISKLKEEAMKCKTVEEELHRWKEEMIGLEMQRQELCEQNEMLEKECTSLKSQVGILSQKNEEVERITREKADLIEICNKLQNEIQSKMQMKEIETKHEAGNNEVQDLQPTSELRAEVDNLKTINLQQAQIIASLTYENNELKHHLQLVSENAAKLNEENNVLKLERNSDPAQEAKNIVNVQNQVSKEKLNLVQQHKRSKSDFDAVEADYSALRLELERLKEMSQQQEHDKKALQEQIAMLSEKEAHSKKELERLRLHLIEIENYYTETIDEYKIKLNVTEEQLKNSSTVYTSTKVRDNQHLEALQGQIRLISAQRDDLQIKLSAAEDEVQKHKAALTSFHVVLKQFEQDKERELENNTIKYENQLALSEKRLTELQQEINSLNGQLSDAKNGLKAASRLGEKLEKKNCQIIELEESLTEMQNEMKELQERAAHANQSSYGKVDKSLLKNLLLGYISAQKADRKTQVLRIMMSVLDFDEEERNKIGMDNTQSGWLSHLLHPRGDAAQTSQSLSEAFIRFLENESRPQPQLKLLPERSPQAEKSTAVNNKPKPSLLLQELVLPTFNTPQSSESTILKDVLNDT